MTASMVRGGWIDVPFGEAHPPVPSSFESEMNIADIQVQCLRMHYSCYIFFSTILVLVILRFN